MGVGWWWRRRLGGRFVFLLIFSVRLGAASGVCAIWQMPRAQKKKMSKLIAT